MSKTSGIFAENDKLLEQNQLVGVPVKRGSKKPSIKEWQKLHESDPETREKIRRSHARSHIGVLMGTPLSTGRNLACLDVDHDGFVPFVEKALGGRACAKQGAKGLSFLVQADPGLKNQKFTIKGAQKHSVEILAQKSMTVIPPSSHPSGDRYTWVGTSVYEIEHEALPILTEECLDLIEMVAANKHAWAIVEGTPSEQTHEKMRSLTACGVAKATDDLPWLCECLNALLPLGYEGDTPGQTLGMLEGAKKKQYGSTPPSKRSAPDSIASTVLQLIEEDGAVLFHDPQGRGYLSVPQANGGTLNHPIRSRAGEDYVRRLYFISKRSALAHNTLGNVLATLDANARFDGMEEQVHLRIAHLDETVFVDLGRADAKVVRINADGWEVTVECPVRFYRSGGSRKLPMPKSGGNLEEFKALLNLDDRSWPLVVAFLINCLKGDGPFMCLLIEGEQGSGKSVLCELLKSIIDPNMASKLRLPNNERDLSIHAKEHYLLIYDNVSGFKGDISDALCALATGSGYAVRRLYTDDELQVFTYCRPFVLNGITEFAHRPDLLERAIPLKLPSMSSDHRLSERELYSRFEDLLPDMLGALFDAVSRALQNIDDTSIPSGIRMADAAQWILASKYAFDDNDDDLLAALSSAQDEVMIDRIHNDPVYIALQSVFRDDSNPLEGTVGKLHDLLPTHLSAQHKKLLPPTPSHLSRHLNRIAPALAKAGIRVTEGPKRRDGKMVRIEMVSTGDSDGDDGDASDGDSTPRPKRGMEGVRSPS